MWLVIMSSSGKFTAEMTKSKNCLQLGSETLISKNSMKDIPKRTLHIHAQIFMKGYSAARWPRMQSVCIIKPIFFTSSHNWIHACGYCRRCYRRGKNVLMQNCYSFQKESSNQQQALPHEAKWFFRWRSASGYHSPAFSGRRNKKYHLFPKLEN